MSKEKLRLIVDGYLQFTVLDKIFGGSSDLADRFFLKKDYPTRWSIKPEALEILSQVLSEEEKL